MAGTGALVLTVAVLSAMKINPSPSFTCGLVMPVGQRRVAVADASTDRRPETSVSR